MLPSHFFIRSVARWPDAVALEDDGGTMTYAELCGAVQALAAGLQSLDPDALSRVGVCAYNSREHLIAWLAVLLAGKTWVPLYPGATAEDTESKIAATEATIVMAEPAALPMVERSATHVLVLAPSGAGSSGALRRRFAGQRPIRHELQPDDTQAIKFTGGSTGRPKGVMQPLRAWNAGIVTQIHSLGFAPREGYLAAAPITHGTSTYLLPTLATGGRILLADRPRAGRLIELLASRKVARSFMAPTMIYSMLAELDGGTQDFTGLKQLVYGGGPMRADAILQAQAVFGPIIASTYGQTEAPQILTFIGPEELQQPDRIASVGCESLLTRVEIHDGDGQSLPAGQSGEIVARGPLVMTGYWRQPDRTAEVLRDGWLYTGDLGQKDERGYLFLKGRSKELIITGGFNVYPADVEPVLGAHPAVEDCAVFGTPDDKWGEAVRAAVQLKANAEISEPDLIGYLRERLGPVQTPKSILFLPMLPRNAYGKLLKEPLVEAWRQTSRPAVKESNSP